MTEVKELYSNSEDLKVEIVTNSSQTSTGAIEDLLAKYLTDFVIEEDTVLGYIDDLDIFKEILMKMKNLGFAFSVRDSDVRHKQREKIKKIAANEKDSDAEKGNELYSHLTFFYQFKAMPIKFFGLPFTIDKTTHYQCAYGCKYYKSRAGCTKMKNENADIKLVKKKKTVGSKKMGCLAKMTIKHITVYPEYKLDIESDWRKKKKLIENLRKDLSDSNKVVNQLRRFYLSVSVQSSHNHPPIITEPKIPTSQRLLKVRKHRKKEPVLVEESPSVTVAEDNEWSYSEVASSSVKLEQRSREELPQKPLNLRDESFFHTLVKFPNTTSTVFEQVEYKQNDLQFEVKPYEFTSNASTVEIYEYEPNILDLQTLFKEKLKNLYTMCTNCTNGPLLLKLAGELEQVEFQLSNDVNYNDFVKFQQMSATSEDDDDDDKLLQLESFSVCSETI